MALPTAGLIRQYRLQQGEDPAVVYDDASGAHGVLNGATWVSDGLFFSFGGSPRPYATIPMAGLPLGDDPFTALVVADGGSWGSGSRKILSWGGIITTGSRPQIAMSQSGNNVQTSMWGTGDITISGQPITDPTSIAIRHEPGSVDLIVDNFTEQGSTAVPALAVTTAEGAYIGANLDTGEGDKFQGTILYVLIWDRALTDAEITSAHNAVAAELSERGVTVRNVTEEEPPAVEASGQVVSVSQDPATLPPPSETLFPQVVRVRQDALVSLEDTGSDVTFGGELATWGEDSVTYGFVEAVPVALQESHVGLAQGAMGVGTVALAQSLLGASSGSLGVGSVAALGQFLGSSQDEAGAEQLAEPQGQSLPVSQDRAVSTQVGGLLGQFVTASQGSALPGSVSASENLVPVSTDDARVGPVGGLGQRVELEQGTGTLGVVLARRQALLASQGHMVIGGVTASGQVLSARQDMGSALPSALGQELGTSQDAAVVGAVALGGQRLGVAVGELGAGTTLDQQRITVRQGEARPGSVPAEGQVLGSFTGYALSGSVSLAGQGLSLSQDQVVSLAVGTLREQRVAVGQGSLAVGSVPLAGQVLGTLSDALGSSTSLSGQSVSVTQGVALAGAVTAAGQSLGVSTGHMPVDVPAVPLSGQSAPSSQGVASVTVSALGQALSVVQKDLYAGDAVLYGQYLSAVSGYMGSFAILDSLELGTLNDILVLGEVSARGSPQSLWQDQLRAGPVALVAQFVRADSDQMYVGTLGHIRNPGAVDTSPIYGAEDTSEVLSARSTS